MTNDGRDGELMSGTTARATRWVAAVAALLLSLVFGTPAVAASAIPVHPGLQRGSACASSSGDGGTITVCPASAPVGATVTVSGTRCDNPGQPVTAVFLGRHAYVGSAGGGVQITIPERNNRFSASFQIPASYPAGQTGNATPVSPGTGYRFAVYPAARCSVDFTVAATSTTTLASTGLSALITPLLALAFALLAIGTWLTVRGRPTAAVPSRRRR